MRAVVGLGNPGREYSRTRHNLGFLVIDALSTLTGARMGEGRGPYLIGEAVVGSERVALIQPMTFMNNSGLAVLDIMERYGIPPGELLIVMDDFSLPLGALRIRLKGSDGGHNGLASILYHAGTDEIPRLRCGIGAEEMPRGSEGLSDFVLSPVAPEEEARAGECITLARDAVMTALTEGLETAMNRFNRIEEQ